MCLTQGACLHVFKHFIGVVLYTVAVLWCIYHCLPEQYFVNLPCSVVLQYQKLGCYKIAEAVVL